MTPEAQRLTIHEALGWVPTKPLPCLGYVPLHAFEKDGSYYGGLSAVPDYLNDLNAMHEAEMACLTTPDQHRSFRFHLQTIVAREPLGRTESLGWRYEQATAAQRAEAFLRTLNIWKE